VEYLAGARILLLILSIGAFFFFARRLKDAFLPAMLLIAAGFTLFMLDLILRPYLGVGLPFDIPAPESSSLVSVIAEFFVQVAGLSLLFFGFYKV
jgi:hypothetical protein